MLDASEFGLAGVLYKAGTNAPPGRYKRIDSGHREIDLPSGGTLPPSFDGSVAVYIRLTPTVRVGGAR